MGVFITRGVDADGLDLEKKWDFVATASKGDDVLGGQVIGTVQETDTITHKIMVPPKASGKIKSIKSGDFNVTETVCGGRYRNQDDAGMASSSPSPFLTEIRT